MKTVTIKKVIDGDTIIMDDGMSSFMARIINIDAPEVAQEYGKICKQWLEEILIGRELPVRIIGKDKYNRSLVHWNEGEVGIDELLVSIGHAWEFTKYNKNKVLESLQNDAIQIRIGIWSDQAPVPPWIWRKLTSVSKALLTKPKKPRNEAKI